MSLKVAIVGASGYTGVELLRLLINHPRVELTCVTSRQFEGLAISDVFPSLAGRCNLVFENLQAAQIAAKADFALTALPHQAAMAIIPDLLAAGCKVVDLSADYRLRDAAVYECWYQPHSSPELLPEAVYGLPELFRTQIPGKRLIANPGCYPTSVALALAPLLRRKLIRHDSLIVDSKSGTSGAGRGAKLGSLFCEVNEGFKAYAVASHRHTPEIEQTLSSLAGEDIVINFTPHLLPVNRGILSTCYASLQRPLTAEMVQDLYQDFYAGEYFVRVHPQGSLPNINQVRGSNYCDLGVVVDERTSRVIVISVIDNLVKGAAGQAVQNLNLLAGLEERTGLEGLAAIP